MYINKTNLLSLSIILLLSSCLGAQKDEARIGDKIIHTRQLRDLMQYDPHRPVYHFIAPEGKAYPFDPNGGIYWNGKYHLGYIYQSLEKGTSEHFWGQAVSTDLFHWTLYPDMLNVKEGDIEKGIFSGGAFISKEGIPHIIYHGQGSSTNLVAYSTDEDLRVWKKFEGNPVLKSPEEGDSMYGKYVAWDPECWYDKETDYYYQISGGYVAGFFRSKDMHDWEYLGDFIDQNNRMRYNFEDISCPDFFKIDDKHILLFISHNLGVQYYIGTFKDGRYTAEKYRRMNWPGGTFFAAEELVDARGRHIIWGWVLERKPDHFPDYGWSGIMSIPRVLSLSREGDMQINPPEEVKLLRLNGIEEYNISLTPNSEKELSLTGASLEIQLEIKGVGNSRYGIKVFCSPDGKEETIIKNDPTTKEIVINFVRSSVNGPVKMRSNCMLDPQLPEFGDEVT
jgi:beta-fructofuranosidase